VGTALFERVGRGVRLTESGRVLAEHAASVLSSVEAAEAAIARLRDALEGRLALGSIPAAMSVLVPRAVARLSRESPGLEISLHEASTPTLIERVRRHELDLAVIGIGPDLPDYDLDGLRKDQLLADTLRIAVPTGHRLAERHRVTVSALRGERWIIGRAPSENDPIFGAWPTLTEPGIAFVAPEWPSRLGMVAAGLGIALLPGISAASVPAGVTVVEVDDPAAHRRSAVALSPSNATQAARAMVTALRTEAATLALRPPPTHNSPDKPKEQASR